MIKRHWHNDKIINVFRLKVNILTFFYKRDVGNMFSANMQNNSTNTHTWKIV